jgi:beta-galactosidase/beta-glucuronidase
MTTPSTNIPRPEYPRPQFARPDWLCLNGEWQFETDPGDSGIERGLRDRDLGERILVPFCPESPLSGVNNLDFMDAVWYRRTVTIPAEWGERQTLLHFQAVDYDATVWVNGVEVGRHRGGFTGFSFSLATIARSGEEITIVVRARDDHRPSQPRGKQTVRQYEPYSCFYPRTTGIWQTVWLEPVPESHLLRPRITPDVANSCLRLDLPIRNVQRGQIVRATVLMDGAQIAANECAATTDFTPHLDVMIPAHRRHWWSTQDPFLYEIVIELCNAAGEVIDRAASPSRARPSKSTGKPCSSGSCWIKATIPTAS